MWRKALWLWRESLLGKPSIVIPLLLLVVLLTPLSAVPGLGLISALLGYYLTLCYPVCVSKSYLRGEEGGGFSRVVVQYWSETLGVMVAQFLLTLATLLLAFLIFLVGGIWSVIKPLLEGGDVSWQGLVVSLVLAVLLYLSVVTSFPLFFGRAMLRGEGFWGTLVTFLSSTYAEISWRTLLSWDYLKSSLLISLISFLFLIAYGIVFIVPPLLVMAPAIGFLTLHLLYLFGTVAVSKLLNS